MKQIHIVHIKILIFIIYGTNKQILNIFIHENAKNIMDYLDYREN